MLFININFFYYKLNSWNLTCIYKVRYLFIRISDHHFIVSSISGSFKTSKSNVLIKVKWSTTINQMFKTFFTYENFNICEIGTLRISKGSHKGQNMVSLKQNLHCSKRKDKIRTSLKWHCLLTWRFVPEHWPTT